MCLEERKTKKRRKNKVCIRTWCSTGLRQRHTQRHHNASDESFAVGAQCDSKTGVLSHFTTLRDLHCMASRSRTHKVPLGRSSVPLPRPDST